MELTEQHIINYIKAQFYFPWIILVYNFEYALGFSRIIGIWETCRDISME